MQSLRNHIAGILALLTVACIGCNRGSVPRMIGSTAPDFTIQDSDRTVSLHDLKGKVIVLNFWASWCKPCVDEMPSLVALQQVAGPKVAILAVSTDKSEQDYHQFLQDYRINFLTVRDPAEKSSHLYGTTGQPETFIIDPSGTIRRKFSGPTNWASPEIREYLSKLQS